MRDFTISIYRKLLTSLQQQGYHFLTFEQYLQHPVSPCVILRHDVDKRPANSVKIAELEHELGVQASYYFRIVPASNHPDAIRRIAELGHEVGYHYEDLSLSNGDTKQAIEMFEEHLAYFRQYYPVKTICMHGAPTSRYDGRDLWKEINYRDYGLIGEPYFDMDFSNAYYLTDTGRCWDGYKVSVRDKVSQQDKWNRQGFMFHTTKQIISWLSDSHRQPKVDVLMITTHPQRWTDSILAWNMELVSQYLKNIIKRFLIWVRG